jgi:hypothetical protein
MYCKECKFWQRDGADGICRREHPKPIIIQTGNVAYSIIWPRTRSDEWCGEFVKLEFKEMNEAQCSYT